MTNDKPIRIAVICENELNLVQYEKHLKKLPIKYDVLKASELQRKQFSVISYNGIILDTPTIMKTKAKHKPIIYEVLNVFPVLRVNYDKINDKVNILYPANSPIPCSTIEEFSKNVCSQFRSRGIREIERTVIHFNILLSKSAEFSEASTEKAVTVNVAENGMFIYSYRDWNIGDKAYVIIDELKDRRPFIVEVRWKVPWGTPLRIPGIGVKIISCGDDQKKEYLKWMT